MNISKISYLVTISLALMASMCGPGDPLPDRGTLKIVLVDSLAIEYDDGLRLLPENMREVCTVLTSDSKDCNHTYILDPTLWRLDLDKQLSLKTTIEKGGAKNVNNPKVIGKLIQKNLEELEIPKAFSSKAEANKDVKKLVNDFIATKSVNDSIFILSESSSSDSQVFNGKSYRVFNDVGEVRNQMLTILCQNEKANFTLLINPPTSDATLKPMIKDTIAIKMPEKKTKTPILRPINQSPLKPAQPDHAILTIIKGSEGCDECTRYYSATDNSGRTREVREKNSTHCCPCGKTIQMRGRTYRMNCNIADGNKLELVE